MHVAKRMELANGLDGEFFLEFAHRQYGPHGMDEKDNQPTVMTAARQNAGTDCAPLWPL